MTKPSNLCSTENGEYRVRNLSKGILTRRNYVVVTVSNGIKLSAETNEMTDREEISM